MGLILDQIVEIKELNVRHSTWAAEVTVLERWHALILLILFIVFI